MIVKHLKKAWLGAICAIAASGFIPPAEAQAGPSDPIYFAAAYPPAETLNGPCGLVVDGSGSVLLSDYYRHAIKRGVPSFNGEKQRWEITPATWIGNVDPLGGPCALAFDASKRLYVNNYHRNVVKYSAAPPFGAGTVFPLPSEDSAGHLPTGVAIHPATDYVYVNNRSYISVYDSTGAPVLDGGEPLRIGVGTLGDAYGLAFSSFAGSASLPSTYGRLYVPDASSNTVKVYDPVADKVNPVAEIKDPFGKPFVSLRDSAIAVDNVTGEIYFADNTQPAYTEKPQAQIYVYSAANAFRGRLKYKVIDALPPGLAVDNLGGATQGRVYVTSGNSDQAGIYAYPPGAATIATPLPPSFGLAVSTSGTGHGLVTSTLGAMECADYCEEQVRAGAMVSLAATPDPGSTFAGWSGAGCEGSGECVVEMSDARSVSAEFAELAGPSPLALASTVVQKGTLRADVSAKISPRKLPREGRAPVAVSIAWKIATTDGTEPPTLKKLKIGINRNGILDPTGLPVCPYAKIQPASTRRALKNCRASLVGRGSFAALVGLEGQESYVAKGKMVIFNSKKSGKPVLYGQIYSAYPFTNSFVIVFKVRKERKKGVYGTTLTAVLPASLRAWGNLTEVKMRLSRRFGYKGKSRSFLSAGCPAPKGFTSAIFRLARTSFTLQGGATLTSVLTDSCMVRR